MRSGWPYKGNLLGEAHKVITKKLTENKILEALDKEEKVNEVMPGDVQKVKVLGVKRLNVPADPQDMEMSCMPVQGKYIL
mgnify:CR=1 FL=1